MRTARPLPLALGHLALCLVALAGVSGCNDSRAASGDAGPRPDAGPGADTGTDIPPPPPGQISLAVEGTSWLPFGEGSLLVLARVGNGLGAEPVSLSPASFAVALTGGAELTASSSAGDPSPCRAELSVTGGGSVSCYLRFDSVFGTPTALHFRPSERTASAPIVTCAPSSPGGLCAFGQVCQGGGCVAGCSFSEPDGACATAGQLCVDGECLDGCSPSNPEGPCEVGACRDGACDASCRYVNSEAEGCYECLAPIYEGVSSCGTASEACRECAFCPINGWSTCECLEQEVCFGCEAEMEALWGCAASACPTCEG